MSTPELRVLIVSPNPLARGGLAAMLEGIAGMKAVGSAGVPEAASLAGQLLPDVVLLDVGDGEIEDLDAIARLAGAQPGLPIVALTGEPGALTQALAFGASALLPVGVDSQTLGAALLASVEDFRVDENGIFDPLSRLLVLLAVVHCEAELRHLAAVGEGPHFRVARQATDQHHFVQIGHRSTLLCEVRVTLSAEAVGFRANRCTIHPFAYKVQAT